jgi:hypothetical protein
MPEIPPETTITVEYEYLAAHDIRFTNAIRFTHISTDIIMDIATLDEQRVIAKIHNPQDPRPVPATVTARFALSLQTLIRLRDNVDQILRKLEDGGIIEAVPAPDTPEDKK